ncbi:large ribosomal subunit protein uL10m-like [Scylla paramamosain]|uniref:large ribosomal subunit protein uL10m-like n=1 Tax=Scylla paramamosain TaxID=85552 RepID=UPI0030832816
MSVTQVSRLLPVRNPIITAVRTRTRTPNISRPAVPHFTRAVVLELIKPIYKKKDESIHPREKCRRRLKAIEGETKQVNPYEQILANEFREKIENAKLVAIFHMLPTTEAGLTAARLQLIKLDLRYVKHNNTIMRLAFTGTKHEALLSLYKSTTCTFVGDELAVAKLLKIQKKLSCLVLLGGIVEGRFMSVKDLEHYASLPSLHTLQAQLVSILGTPAQQLSQNLSANQMELSSALSRYADDTKPEGDPKPEGDSEASPSP